MTYLEQQAREVLAAQYDASADECDQHDYLDMAKHFRERASKVREGHGDREVIRAMLAFCAAQPGEGWHVVSRAEQLPMVAVADRLPVREDGEQAILTYSAAGFWDIQFYESSETDQFEASDFLGATHWLDISRMWPGVEAQVTEWMAETWPAGGDDAELIEALKAERDDGWGHKALLDRAISRIETLAKPRPDREAVLNEAVEPWKDFHGDLPDYDHPLRCVFESGVQYTVELLAKELGVEDWTPCDGTEEFDGDLGGTLVNIVMSSLPTDQDGDHYHPRDIATLLPAEPVQEMREGAFTDKERLDFLDCCNQRLNERYGTNYRWELILNHNVTRLMLGGHLVVDLNDSSALGTPSCRDAIDQRLRAATAALSEPQEQGEGDGQR